MEDSPFLKLPFFYTRNLDLDSKRLLAAQLKEWRERARPDELAATVLQLGPRYISQDVTATREYEPRREDFVNCREYPCTHFNWPPTRAAPASFATTHDALRIIEPLPFQTGLDLNSQVYTASFELDPGVPQAEEVIVKIYQMSLYQAVPDVVEDPAQPWGLWGMTSGMDEEWAYRQMQTLQGGIVPHVYGFFQVRDLHLFVHYGSPAQVGLGDTPARRALCRYDSGED